MAVASWKHRVPFSIIATSFAISTMNQEPLFWATTTDSSSTGMNLGEKRMPSGEKYDGLWVSHGKYLAMNENLKNRLEWPFLAG